MAGKGKILVMDDEQIILEVTHEVLNFLNYDGMFASDGQTAIDIYKKEKNAGAPFDIVILDLSVQNGMGGKETIEELRKFDPAVKGIVSTGFANDPVVENFSQYGFSGKLTKPYKISDLKDILEQLIKKQ